jgi:hypothetical protein
VIAGSSRLASGVLALVLAAACGGSSGGVNTGMPAAKILAASASQLGRTGSYHVAGMIDPGLIVDLVVRQGGLSGTVTSHGVTWNLVVVGPHEWVRGAALWRATLPAATFGDGWVQVEDFGVGFGLGGAFVHLRELIVNKVFGPHPGLKVSGVVTLAGRRAVELRSSKDTYDVALDGPAYPLRWLDGDIPGPGGRPCGITLDRFETAGSVTPPSPVVGTLEPGAMRGATPTPIAAG